MIPATTASPDSAASSSDRSPLRILSVGNMYPPQHAGGYEVMWQAAVRSARAAGHSVRVLTTDFRANDEPEDDPDVHRTLCWYWDLERYRFPELSFRQRLRLERGNAAELTRHLSAFRPHVVSWWAMGCMSLSMIEQVRRLRVPANFVVHDDWLVYGREFDQWQNMWRGPRRGRAAPIAERIFGIPTQVDVRRAGAFVFNSRYTRDRAVEAGQAPSDSTVVYPGIDPRFLATSPPSDWRWRLLYVGRLDRQKGIDTIVEALAHLPPQTSLTVVGSGEQRYVEELRVLASRLGAADRLTFSGFASVDEVVKHYSEADAVVFPVRWNEPFGLVPVEAMGMNRPVIATSRGGSAEFIQDGDNALVFPADEPEALAGCIRRLAADPALRARLCCGGQRTASAFTIDAFASKTVAAIERSAHNPPATSQ